MVRTVTEGGKGRARKIVIAGEMLELGDAEARLHYQAGREIAGAGVDELWGVRGLARELVNGASDAGLAVTKFFPDSESAGKALVAEVRQGDLVLVKGSRGVATD
jgi:UDP-N-acetylmuramoyl-tripeptide--D-alanyl-D-alanine ligase